ncbi:MAG: DUF488 domain-containing protein [Microcoleaceae cyanobacterium]
MKSKIKLFTIGFTKKTAQHFFETLINAGVEKLIDARLNNSSQLAGFAKRKDLEYFLKVIGKIDYVHCLELAPTKEILENYKKNGGNWQIYEKQFIQLMGNRQIEQQFYPEQFNKSCLLCSEATPEYCHRRLVAEYLQEEWINVDISHL